MRPSDQKGFNHGNETGGRCNCHANAVLFQRKAERITLPELERERNRGQMLICASNRGLFIYRTVWMASKLVLDESKKFDFWLICMTNRFINSIKIRIWKGFGKPLQNWNWPNTNRDFGRRLCLSVMSLCSNNIMRLQRLVLPERAHFTTTERP